MLLLDCFNPLGFAKTVNMGCLTPQVYRNDDGAFLYIASYLSFLSAGFANRDCICEIAVWLRIFSLFG